MTVYKGALLDSVSQENVSDRSMTLSKTLIDRSMTVYKGAPLDSVSLEYVIDRSIFPLRPDTLNRRTHDGLIILEDIFIISIFHVLEIFQHLFII